MNMQELSARTGVAERQIRYLIAEGFIPAPTGGRATADYSDEHVNGIERYSRLKSLGFAPAAIKVLLHAGQGVPFVVGPGLTLTIDPKLIASGQDIELYAEKIKAVLRQALQDGSHVKP
jgi:MerR family transcriptional regulator, copper efflux regulator